MESASEGRSVLQRFLGAVSPGEFFEKYWEKQHLHVAGGAADNLEDLLPPPALDELLSRNDLRFPAVRAVKGGQSVPLSEYSQVLKIGSYAADDLIDMDRLLGVYHRGATIVFQSLERSTNALAGACRDLGSFLGGAVNAHGFLTPPNSQGLSAHYDTASAFFVQVRGAKRWQLFEMEVEAPFDEQAFDERRPIRSAPIDEVILEAGDCLYVPGGLPHNGTTSDSDSLHLTFVLLPTTWIDILAAALSECERDAAFRRAPTDWMMQASDMAAFEREWATLARRFEESPVPIQAARSVKRLVLPSDRRGRWT